MTCKLSIYGESALTTKSNKTQRYSNGNLAKLNQDNFPKRFSVKNAFWVYLPNAIENARTVDLREKYAYTIYVIKNLWKKINIIQSILSQENTIGPRYAQI